MAEPLRWGILATGLIADLFVTDLLAASLTVTAVGSRSEQNARAFADRFGIANVHGNYEALVQDPDVDIIYVATPHPFHADNARIALEAGKHVLVEKAFTLNASEASAIAALAQEKELVLMEAMWTRFLPHMVRIRQILADGTLGELRSLHAEHRQDLPKDPSHRLNDPALGGGALLDLGIYPVSFAYDILGAPSAISVTSRPTATGVDAEVAITMQHQGSAISTSVSALDCAGTNAATIYGSKARIEIEGIWYIPTSFKVIDHQGNLLEEFNQTVESRGMQFQAFEMERLIKEGRTSGDILPLEESIAIMDVLDEIRKQIGLVYPGEE